MFGSFGGFSFGNYLVFLFADSSLLLGLDFLLTHRLGIRQLGVVEVVGSLDHFHGDD